MELKEGMYVRTDDGYIFEIKELLEKGKYNDSDNKIVQRFRIDGMYKKNDDYIETDYMYSDWVIKASYNIIDLIEEKDLLEIEYFSLRYKKRVTRLFEVTFKDERYINLDNAKCQFMLIDNDWSNSDKELEPIIKSIVTKEQFSQISYNLPKDK